MKFVVFFLYMFIGQPFGINRCTFLCQVETFLTIDSFHWNDNPYAFVNNSATNYVDRNGLIPIKILKTVPSRDARELLGYLQRLTNDHLTLTQRNPSFDYTIVNDRVEGAISNPVGTQLLRELEDASPILGASIDIENTAKHMSTGSSCRTYKSPTGMIDLTNIGDYSFNNINMKMSFIRSGHVSTISKTVYNNRGKEHFLSPEGKLLQLDVVDANPMEIILAHELIHSNRQLNGKFFLWNPKTQLFKSLDNIEQVIDRSPLPENSFRETISREEILTIGLTLESPQNNALEGIDFSNRISENAIRREQHLPFRMSHCAF